MMKPIKFAGIVLAVVVAALLWSVLAQTRTYNAGKITIEGGGGVEIVGALTTKDSAGTTNEVRSIRGTKLLTDATATDVFTITIPTNNFAGGTVNYTIFGNLISGADGTTNVVGSGMLTYSAVSGTNGAAFTNLILVALNDVQGDMTNNPTASGSTLSWSWSTVQKATDDKVYFQLNADHNLLDTATLFEVMYTIVDNTTKLVIQL